MQDVFDRRNAADGFLGENAQFQRERACEPSIEIYGAAAHAGDDASVLDPFAFELNQDDRLLRAEEIGHHADNFEVEFFDLIAGKNRVGVALHAGAHLAQGDGFVGLR